MEMTVELSFHKLPLLTFKLIAIYFAPQILPLADVKSCDLQTRWYCIKTFDTKGVNDFLAG